MYVCMYVRVCVKACKGSEEIKIRAHRLMIRRKSPPKSQPISSWDSMERQRHEYKLKPLSYVYIHVYTDTWMHKKVRIKLIAFELAAKFSRRRQNPVQPRLYHAKNAIFKLLKTGFSLRSRSSPANSNAISFMPSPEKEHRFQADEMQINTIAA